MPYGAGGGTDVTARLLAKDLEPVIGKPVTVENRAGGGGWIGWGALAAAKPDGYTLGYLNVPSMFAGYLDPQIGRKERLESFTPIINHVIDYNVWAVKADSPFKTVKDVVDAAKKQPSTITVTAYGAGSDDHIAILGRRGRDRHQVHRHPLARARPRPRPRRSAGTSMCSAQTSARWREEVRAGQFRLLGVMAPARSRFLPNAPTFKEQGFNQVWSVTRGIATPANLAKDAQAKLTAALGAGHQLEGASGARRAAQPRAAGDPG